MHGWPSRAEHTTANLLLNKIYPSVKDRRAYLFSDIAEAVMTGECDAGVLIHEGRFVYRKIGLQLDSRSRRRMGKTHRTAAAARGHRRIAAARRPTATENRPGIAPQHRICTANPAVSAGFVRQYAQELSEEVTRSHIELFVNDYSVDLGAEGRKAVTGLLGTETFGIKEEEVFV